MELYYIYFCIVNFRYKVQHQLFFWFQWDRIVLVQQPNLPKILSVNMVSMIHFYQIYDNSIKVRSCKKKNYFYKIKFNLFFSGNFFFNRQRNLFYSIGDVSCVLFSGLCAWGSRCVYCKLHINFHYIKSVFLASQLALKNIKRRMDNCFESPKVWLSLLLFGIGHAISYLKVVASAKYLV